MSAEEPAFHPVDWVLAGRTLVTGAFALEPGCGRIIGVFPLVWVRVGERAASRLLPAAVTGVACGSTLASSLPPPRSREAHVLLGVSLGVFQGPQACGENLLRRKLGTWAAESSLFPAYVGRSSFFSVLSSLFPLSPHCNYGSWVNLQSSCSEISGLPIFQTMHCDI